MGRYSSGTLVCSALDVNIGSKELCTDNGEFRLLVLVLHLESTRDFN